MIGGCFSISALALKLVNQNIVYMNKGTKDPGSLHIGTACEYSIFQFDNTCNTCRMSLILSTTGRTYIFLKVFVMLCKQIVLL